MSKEISKHNIAIGVLCIAFMAYALICSIVFVWKYCLLGGNLLQLNRISSFGGSDDIR